jgi:hypothetical protein
MTSISIPNAAKVQEMNIIFLIPRELKSSPEKTPARSSEKLAVELFMNKSP